MIHERSLTKQRSRERLGVWFRTGSVLMTAWALGALGGCIAARFIPVKGPPSVTPEGVEVVRFAGGLRVPVRELAEGEDLTQRVGADSAVSPDAPESERVSLEGRMYAPGSVGAERAGEALANASSLPEGARRGVVLFCHGVLDNNASPMARWFRQGGFRVFMLDYRGFGASDKSNPPSLQGIIEDTRAALAYLRSRPDVDPDRIVIAGHSMGGAMALAAGASAEREGRPVRAVVAMGSISNWRVAVGNNVGPLGFVLGGADAPNATRHARELVKTPLLLVHARDDSIVPAWHSEQLAKSNWAGGGRAQLLLLPAGEHVGAYLDYPSFAVPVLAWMTHHLRDDARPDPLMNEQTDDRLRKASGR